MTLSSVLPPSARLPPIRRIREQPLDVLAACIEYLSGIYNPPVRGTRRVDRKKLQDSSKGADARVLHEHSSEELRADEFERAYAVRWLTGLVSQVAFLEDSLDEDGAKTEVLVRSASSLLGICAGTAAARTLTRLFTFRSPTLDADVEVELTDIPIAVQDGEAPTVGTQTWGSAPLLAEMLVEDPARFGLSSVTFAGTDGGTDAGCSSRRSVRVLELGAGTGLVSLALAKSLSLRASHAGMDRNTQVDNVTIVASDYHPMVLANLAHNIRANFADGTPHVGDVPLSAHALDWSTFASPQAFQLSSVSRAAPFDAPFDLIFGADVVYEPAHAFWIRDCVHALLRRPEGAGNPSATPESDYAEEERVASGCPRFHLVMPLRPTHAFESRAIEEAFPSLHDGSSRSGLCVLEKETIACEADHARSQDVEYVHYTIGWTH